MKYNLLFIEKSDIPEEKYIKEYFELDGHKVTF